MGGAAHAGTGCKRRNKCIPKPSQLAHPLPPAPAPTPSRAHATHTHTYASTHTHTHTHTQRTRLRSSHVPFAQRKYTLTGLVPPLRCARSSACRTRATCGAWEGRRLRAQELVSAPCCVRFLPPAAACLHLRPPAATCAGAQEWARNFAPCGARGLPLAGPGPPAWSGSCGAGAGENSSGPRDARGLLHRLHQSDAWEERRGRPGTLHLAARAVLRLLHHGPQQGIPLAGSEGWLRAHIPCSSYT